MERKVTEQLEDVFNHRADHLLPPLVTTNLDFRELTPCIQARINRLADAAVLG